MNQKSHLKAHIDSAGGAYKVAGMLGLSPKAVYKWLANDELPSTEYSGKTCYTKIIERKTAGTVKAVDLLKAGKPKQAA